MNFTSQIMNAIYSMAVGYGTEAGATPYQITVARDKSGNPIDNSGYTLGVVQFDFGAWPEYAQKLVSLVENWAATKGLSGFSNDSNVVSALKSNKATGGLIELGKADLDLLKSWGDDPANQSYFSQNFEQVVINRSLQGTKTQTGVNAILDNPDFQKLSDADQISIITTLDKVANQGGLGALQVAYRAVSDNIPSGTLNASSLIDALDKKFGEKNNASLTVGITQASSVGDVLGMIVESPTLSKIFSSVTSSPSFDISTVNSNPAMLMLKTLLEKASKTLSQDDETLYIGPNPSVVNFINSVNNTNGGKLYSSGGVVMGVTADGELFVLTNNGTQGFLQKNGQWQNFGEGSTSIIKKVNGQWQLAEGSDVLDLGSADLSINGQKVSVSDASLNPNGYVFDKNGDLYSSTLSGGTEAGEYLTGVNAGYTFTSIDQPPLLASGNASSPTGGGLTTVNTLTIKNGDTVVSVLVTTKSGDERTLTTDFTQNDPQTGVFISRTITSTGTDENGNPASLVRVLDQNGAQLSKTISTIVDGMKQTQIYGSDALISTTLSQKLDDGSTRSSTQFSRGGQVVITSSAPDPDTGLTNTTATVSGQGATINLNGAEITFSVGASATLMGAGNSINLGNDNKISVTDGNILHTSVGDISISGNGLITNSADGNTLKIQDNSGSLKTSVVTVPANADHPLTIKRIDYLDSSDPNVQLVRIYDDSKALLSTTNITQAFDNTSGSPTYGQPVPNTYNLVNEDASGNITSTGQREINPADGSYQDTLIGSATAANPGGTIQVNHVDSSGNTTPVISQTGVLTLSNEVSAFNDAYALIKAVQSGQPLPIVGSGLRLTNDLSNGSIPQLSMAGNAIGVVTGIEGMANALKTGDIGSGIVSGANTFVQGFNLYTSIAYGGDLINAAGNGLGGLIDLSNTLGHDLQYLNLANDLIHGNYTGAVGDAVGIYVADALAEAEIGAEIGSAAGPIGALAGLVVGSVLSDIFGDDPPEPWGSASVGWSPDGSYRVDAVGDAGGDQTSRNVLSNLVGGLQNIANQYNNLGQPGLQLGIIPERLGSISFNNNQFHINTVDAATGQTINSDLYFDTNGNVVFGSTYDGNDAYFKNLGAYYTSNALARQAIAPEWEVQTAQMQAQAGLSNAGLTEVQRAANLGELATPALAGSAIETWNPIALDLGGGLATTSLTGSAVQFNVDGIDNLDANLTGSNDTQYLHQTAWLNKTDGFLVLDENMNGSIDNGEEMFSDSQVAAGYRGVASLSTYDANGDGVINATDPVFAQLGVWIDAQGNGQMTSANYHSLASLGIASLNYRLGTYTRNDGSVHEMGTLSLQADTSGTSYAAAPNGIQLTTTDGQVTLAVTRLNDLSSVEANEVSFTTNEDVPAVIQVRGNGSTIQGLLDTDSVSNAPNAILQLQSVQNAQGGNVIFNAQNGTVTFTPFNGFSGTAGFDYTINAGAYGAATAHVEVDVAQVDHPPVITGNTLQTIPIYGYEYTADAAGNVSYLPLYQPGEGFGDANGGGGYAYRSTAVSYQTNPDAGTLSATDRDFPSSALTWSVINQARYGNATVDAHGNWSFSPNSAIGGSDAFIVQVRDPLGGTAQYTVSVPLPSPAAPAPGTGGDGGSEADDSGAGSGTAGGTGSSSGDGTGSGSGTAGGDGTGSGSGAAGGDGSGSGSAGGDGSGAGGADGSGGGSGSGGADGDGGGGGGGDGGDPLILDLKGNGFHFTSVNDSNVFFEQSADGLRHQTAWFSGGNGILAYNKYGDGRVRDSSQIDFYKQVTGATNDLQALQILAGGAKQLDASSSVWNKLGVWVDVNANGQSETGEFETLSQLGIKSINFTDTPAFSVQNGVVIHEMATFTYVDGTTQNMAEVTLPFSNKVLAGTQITQVAQGSLANPITAGEGNNLILGNSGDNAISAGNGNNVVITGAGNDLIRVGDGNNSIQSGDGNDLIVAGNGNNAILLGAGPKTVVVGAGANTVVGGNGNNVIMAGEGNNVLYAGSGNSLVFAEDGNNTLVGGVGHNELIAGNGNNSFTDGGGIADMTAGTGSNTFVVNNTQDSITVAAPVAGKTAGVNTVKSSVNWTLGANQQILWGTGNSALTLIGNSTGDEIIGNGAADTLIGGSGNDTLADSGGAALMIGGGGNDTFVVSNTASVVQETANSGTATLKTSVSYSLPDNVQNLIGTGNAAVILRGGTQDGTTITANDANDTLIAGSGVSTLIGGAGSDTFVVNNVNDVVQAQAGGINTVQTSVNYTAGVHVQNLVGTGAADLILRGNGAGDTVQANAGNDTLIAAAGADSFIGGSGNDTYQLGDGNESVLLGTGNSVVTGGRANAVINGLASGSANITLGDGQVQIDLSQNNQANAISLGNGADSVSAGNGNNTISVGDGTDLVSTGDGNNLVNAGNGNDVITVGNGNNRIAIGSGTNQVTVGTGTDVVTNWNGNDTLLLEQNVPADTVNFVNLGNDIQINESLSNGSVRVVGASATPSSALGQYVLGNGNDTISLDASSYQIRAGNGNDNITGLNASETLSLGNGNSQVTLGDGSNQVTVGNGNNTLSFGNGDNSLVNGTGNNLIRFGVGNNSLANNGGFDQVTFDAGSNGGIVNYSVSGQDVIVGSPSWAAGGSVKVLNAQSSGAGTTEFVFDNSNYDVGLGTANAGFKAGNGNNTVIGDDGNDLVALGNGANYVQLGNGNDKVTTSDSSYVTNTIMLGNGNDQVQVGDGNNYVSVGSGINTLTGGDGNNDFALGAGRNQVNLGNGNNSVVLDQGQDQLTLGNGNNTLKGSENAGVSKTVVAGNGNDQISLGQGDDTLSLGSGSLTITLGDGKDSIRAQDISTSTSSVTVGNGADTIILGDGADNIYLGNGNDQVSAGNGNDQVYGGSGNSQVSLGNGNSTVSLGDGNNKISLGDGNNVVDLGNGNNVLSVGNGNNTINLNGSVGSDILILGNGVDTVSSSGSTQDYQLGSGQYVINNWSGQDSITLTTANASQLWFQQQNGDLDITVLGSNESVKLTNWFYGSAASSITTADGAAIDDATVANLVQAMAAFSPPAPGQTSYTAAEQSAVEPLLASSRH